MTENDKICSTALRELIDQAAGAALSNGVSPVAVLDAVSRAFGKQLATLVEPQAAVEWLQREARRFASVVDNPGSESMQ